MMLQKSVLTFFGNHLESPRTGGEAYDSEIIRSLKEMDIRVRIVDAAYFPSFFRCLLGQNLCALWIAVFTGPSRLYAFDLGHISRTLAAFLWCSLVRRGKVILVAHHFVHQEKTRRLRRGLHRIIEKMACRLSQYAICNSNHTKSQLDSTHPKLQIAVLQPFLCTPARELEVPPVGLHYPFRLLWVGTIEPRKNLEIVLAALAKAPASCELKVVGRFSTAEYESTIQSKIKSFKLKSKVTFVGRVSREKLDEHFRWASIFILVSKLEGYGMVYAEAMSYGLPVIAGNRGGVSDIVQNGTHGFLCNPQDVNSVVNAIEKLSDPGNWNSCSDACFRSSKLLSDVSVFRRESAKIILSFGMGQV